VGEVGGGDEAELELVGSSLFVKERQETMKWNKQK